MIDSNYYCYENVLTAIENRLFAEKNFPTFSDQLHIRPNQVTVSGLKDSDYPSVSEFIGGNLRIDKTVSIPIELQERIKDMKQNCLMGVYAEVDRLWLTVDSDFFLWNYEQGSDLAYYDGFADTILAVGFIKPKKGLFHPSIQYLLCLAGQVEIVILGVTVTGYKNNNLEFIPEPIFRISSDNEHVTVIQEVNGRILLGTKSGNILEIIYWSEKPSWFNFTKSSDAVTKYAFEIDNKLCVKLINHSIWKLSMLLPSVIFNGLMLNESIVQMAVDSTRNMIYTRSETSLIAQYELLPNDGIRRLSYLTEENIVSKAAKNVKSVDKTQFKNIVELCPLAAGHGNLHLMAVTQSGVRLYFTDNLRLSHVRMPPMSPSAVCGKVNNVRLCCESRGSVMMVCGSSVENQAIYTVCPDGFLLPELIETVSVSWANNGAWLLVPLDKHNLKRQSTHPIMLTQHLDPIRRFLMISSESIVQLELPSPIHQLRFILEKNTSPQCSQIKSWINHYGSEETVYAALVIASDTKNQFLSSRATEVVLYHLSESIKTRSLLMTGPQVSKFKDQSNPLHEALSMYAARILRPMWDNCIGELYKSSEKETFIISTMDSEELKWFMHHLGHLHDFIRDNYPRLKSIDIMKMSLTNKPIIPLALELLELLKSSVEIISLWCMLSEHQFHLIMKFLSAEMQNEVIRCPMKQLLLPHKRSVLLSVISALLEYYLSDGANTDSVISALLNRCPSIYRTEDALCSRANEMLVMIDNMTKGSSVTDNDSLKHKKEQILIEAVQLYEQVGVNLDLGSVVCRLRSVGCLWGAVHLCLQAAKVRDPEQFSLICFKGNHQPTNAIEEAAIEGRNDAYKYMIECISTLLEATKFNLSRSTVVVNQGDLILNQENGSSAYNDLNIILASIFDNKDDILAHYEVYSWMIDNELTPDILKYNTTHLEAYLLSKSETEPQSIVIKNLLWRYYEMNGRLLEAAKVLDNMAVTECQDLSLDERLECLSRAVVSVKAMIGDDHGFEMDFLKELEDKLEIAQLQKVIIEEIGNDQCEAHRQLNSRLCNMYSLLKDYAEPLDLTVSKLFILRASGQSDPENITMIWEEFIEKELDKMDAYGSLEAQQVGLKQAIMRVTLHFKDSLTFLPLDIILYHLESYCDMFHYPIDWTISCLLAVDISIIRIIQGYNNVLKMKEQDLKQHLGRIYNALCFSFDIFLHSNIHPREKQIHCSQFLDIISSCLIQLQSRSDDRNHGLVEKLRVIKTLMEQSI